LRFVPEDGGRCEFLDVFFGADGLASSTAIRPACAAINAAGSSSRASFSASLNRYLGPLVTHMLTRIRWSQATLLRHPGEQIPAES